MKNVLKVVMALTIILAGIIDLKIPDVQAESTFAEYEITVVYDGEVIVFSQPPLIRNDYAFYPLEDVLQAFCGGHGWNYETFVVSGYVGWYVIEIPLRDLCYIANGSVLDVPDVLLPFVENERTYVYLDYIIESLGMSVDWDGDTKTIHIYSFSEISNNYNQPNIESFGYFADVPQDAPYTEAVNIFCDMGFFSIDESGNFNPEDVITRAEFAVLMVKMMGEESVLSDTSNYFDVPTERWDSGWIEAAVRLGIINDYGNNMFGPSDVVTYEQAIKALVHVSGHKDKAEEAGGYPDGYLAVGQSFGITTGTDILTGNSLTRSVLAILMYNCFFVD